MSRKLKDAPLVREPRENMSRTQTVVGLAGRAFVLFLCVLGAALFLADALAIMSPASDKVASASPFAVVVSALLFSAAAAVSSYDRRAMLVVPILSVASFAGALAIIGNPVAVAWDGVRCTWNTAIARLEEHYMSFSAYRLAADYRYDEATLLAVGAAILCAVLAAIFALCLIRRARAVPTAIVCAAILVPIFVYNLTRHTAGIAFAIVFIAAALSLCLFDRRYLGSEFAYVGRREKRAAKKAARKAKRDAKREKRKVRRRREREAYERALAVSDSRSLARQAKRAVGGLERKAKREKKKLEYEEAREKKRLERKAKKEAKALAAKEKKRAAAERKRLAAAARTNEALAKRLAAEKREKLAAARSAKSVKKQAKKAKRAEKRAAERERNEKRLANIAGGGVAGLLAAAIALACVAVPALAISGKFPTIQFIDRPVSVAREYVTAYLKGDDVDLNNLDIYGELAGMVPRKLSFDPLTFEGTQIFVATGDLTQNVYLRSWIARDFDEEAQQWNGSTRDEVLEYRKKFSRDFSPDEIRTRFTSLVDPTSAYIVDNGMVFARQGFAVERVNLRRINAPTKLIFVPATMNTDYGVLAYGQSEPIDVKYSHFYDGVYSSRFFEKGTSYSTLSIVADLRDAKVADGMADRERYFNLALSYLGDVEGVRETLKYRDLAEGETTEVQMPNGRVYVVGADDLSDIDVKFREQLAAEDVKFTGDSLVMRGLEDEAVYEQMQSFAATEKKYREYAFDTYTNTFGGEKVAALAETLLSDAGYIRKLDKDGTLKGFADAAGNDVPDHAVIMTVIDYLRRGYEYTLTPTAPESSDESVLEAFLFDVKEGYCTHFATAACALLRAYGYPVRFCEGYVANEFHTNYGEKVDAKYYTMVHDDDAHAWIEVYLGESGWQQYETTPAYAEPMYDPDYVAYVPEEDPDFVAPAPTEPEIEKKPVEAQTEDEENEEEEFDYARLFTVLGIVAGAIVLVAVSLRLVWAYLAKKARQAEKKRREPVLAALADARRDGEANRAIALELNDQIMEVFAIAGFAPEDGEGVPEFSERVADTFEGLSETPVEGVVEAMMRAEFGNGLERGDLIVIGDFLDRLAPSAYGTLSPAKKLWWRYIKRKI